MLSIQIFSDTEMGIWLADHSHARGLKFGTNPHGFASCSYTIASSHSQALAAYDWPGVPHLIISDRGGVVWEGRIEDVSVGDGFLQIAALGYWRAYSDAPYTALWSDDGVGRWRFLTSNDNANAIPDRWRYDNNNRLYVAPVKGETYYGFSTIFLWSYSVPHESETEIARVNFDWEFYASSDYIIDLGIFDSSWSPVGARDWTRTGNGALQSGSASVSLASSSERIAFRIRSASSPVTYSGETGAFYFKATSARVKALDTASITADDIVTDLNSYISGINSDQVSSLTTGIDGSGQDLRAEVYEDKRPSEIMTELGTRLNLEAQVWEDRILYWRAKEDRLTWYVDVVESNFQRSLDAVTNSAYAVYRDASGQTKRTGIEADNTSVARAGITRRGFVSVQTTSESEAEVYRDALLTDRGRYEIRADIQFDYIVDATGASWPLYAIRSGDRIVLRTMWPVSTELQSITEFRVASTEYNRDSDTIRIEPDDPIPTLVTLAANK